MTLFNLRDGRLFVSGIPVEDVPAEIIRPEPVKFKLEMTVICRECTVHNERTASLEFAIDGIPKWKVIDNSHD